MGQGKPFCISKQVVREAYKKVKANQGAAGVDAKSIEDFEKDLKNNLYRILESHVVRDVLSASGSVCCDTEEGWGHEVSGHPHRVG